MRLGLSSAAAPGANAGELIDACALRGLAAIELRAGDAHGLDAYGIEVDDDGVWAGALRAAADAGVKIAGYATAASEGAAQLAQLSRALNAPVIVADECSVEERIDRAARIGAEGGRALVLTRGDIGAWHDAVVSAGAEFAWEMDAAATDVAAEIDIVLGGGASDTGLRYIRFIGGGPEASLQDGRGIGTVMGRLALAAYDGPLILAPSSTRYRVAWETWLGRRGGWGCGSKSADAGLVNLMHGATTGGA